MDPDRMLSDDLPHSVRIAALLLGLYGVAVLVNAVVLQTLGGWQEWTDFPRALIRSGGMALLVWGLLKRHVWAWWLGVILPSIFALFGAAAAITWLALGGDTVGFPLSSLLFVLGSAATLTIAVTLLLLRTSRVAFRRPAA